MNLSNFTETPFCRVVARFLILTMLCYGLPVQAAVPIADAGSNQVIEKTELSGGRTMLDGGASFDPDGDPLSFQWFGPFFRLFDLAPQAVVPEGLSTVALQVDDGSATSSADTATVEVVPCFSINTRPKPGKVQLTWSPQADAQRYDIYRSTEAAPVNFVKIGETTSDYSTYLDTPVDNEATYLYQVNAVTVTGTCFSGVDSTHPTTSRRRGLNYAPVIYSTPVARASENIVYGSDINATDPNDDTLTYHLTQSPADMTIDQVNGLIHWIPAVTGTFPVTVQVEDGQGSSDSQSFNIIVSSPDAPNRVPSADAGSDQTVFVDDNVILDGSSSSDPDGDALTYSWQLVSVPAGSAAALSDTIAVKPSFTIDLSGTYVAQLIVNDGNEDSAPDEVIVTTTNSAPVADAGPNQTVLVTDTVTLDGSGSSDVDGDPLSFKWSLTGKPASSAAVLSDTNATNPSFVVDVAGTYVVELVVHDGLENSAPGSVTIDTANTPPVANAGADQTVLVGTTVDLDASNSSDVDGNALTFVWSLTGKPVGSAAVLSDPNAVMPSFVVDVAGTYVAQLFANDGVEDSAPDSVTIDTTNSQPIAKAGPGQTVRVGDTVDLDGSASSDVDGDPLTYAWSLTTIPNGSSAALSDDTAVMPTFDIDLPGTFVAQLMVNDGLENSAPDTTTIITENTPPVADAGPDQTVQVNDIVTLDGAGSSDADNDMLTHSWSLSSIPQGSAATLTDTAALNPTFVVDLPGIYMVQLIVNDGSGDSEPDTVVISTGNSRPVADAGADQTPVVGDTVTLDGSASDDVDGDELTYQWSMLSAPAGSTATLSDPSAVNPNFDIDRAGTYVVQLIVNDGSIDSIEDSVTIITENTVPQADAGDDQTVIVGATVTLDGSASSDVDEDALTYQWTLTTTPAGSSASLSNSTTDNPTFTADVAGTYVAELTVNDGSEDSTADTVNVEAQILVPNVTNQSQANAEAAIVAAGLTVGKITSESSDSVTAGNVIRQAPASGTQVSAGAAVDLVISTGPALVPVPNVVGQDQAAAETAIVAADLTVGNVTTQNSDTVPAGDVISQNPVAGGNATSGSAVDLMVSVGSLSPAPDLQPPLIVVQGATVNVGETASVLIQATDNVAVKAVTLMVDGVLTPIGPNDHAIVNTVNPGVINLVATAVDSSGNQATETAFVYALGPNDGIAPTAVINSPAAGAELSASVDIIGTATDDALTRWELTATPLTPSDSAPIFLADGTAAVDNGVLGVFDPTIMGGGEYRLRLTVQDEGGLVSESDRIVTSVNQAKYGLFSITFSDAVVSLPSFPLIVQRTYQSGDRARQGDFGFGWHLGLRSVRLDVDNKPGDDWTRQNSGRFLPNWVLVPLTPHTVTIVDDDENAIIFEFTPSFNDPVFDATFASAAWTERTATGATLVPQDTTLIVFSGDQLLSLDTFDVYNPSGYVLTMPDGRRYTFDVIDGLTQYRDANGNTLNITISGIVSSGGLSVSFARDADGRITQVAMPSGATTKYRYDSAGNLVSVTDPEGHETTFAYDRNHYLLGIVDPLGRVPMRNEYDADGRLVALIDGEGNRIEFTIDPVLRRQTLTDRLGNVTVQTYDSGGRVVEVLEPDGSTRQFTWDTNGNKISETDGLGRTTFWTYDSRRRVTSHTDALGNKISYTYDGRGNLTVITDPLSRTQSIEYDTNGNPTREIFADGSFRMFTYDGQGNLLSETDALGGVTTHEYNAQGFEIRKVTPAGRVTRFAYDSDGRRIQETDPAGRIRLFEYDDVGNITTNTGPLGSQTRNVYDPLGQRVEQTDPLGGQRMTAYDELGRVIREIDPTGSVTVLERDAKGQVIRQTDPNGRITTTVFDTMGRVIRRSTEGTVEERAYDAAGQLISATDGNGNVTTFVYDQLGRLLRTTFPDGTSEISTYDSVGNLLSRTTPLGVTQFTYDERNRMTSRTDPDGETTGFSYDSLGRTRSVSFPDATSLEYEYDPDGRITKITDALGNVAAFDHDGNGNRATFTDPLGRTTTYSYDERGFAASREVEGVVLERYTNNAMGWITARTDANGQVTQYSYDGVGRVTRIEYPDGSFAGLTYTLTGQRTTVTDSRGVTRYTYDASDRLSSVSYPDGQEVRYRYNTAGRLQGLSTSAGDIAYELDTLGRTTAVIDPSGGRYIFARDAAGQVTSVSYPNGVSTQINYDGNGRPTEKIVLGPSGNELAHFTADRDVVGRVIGLDETGDALMANINRTYLYDAASRLIRTTISRDSTVEDDQQYTLDAFGSRTQLIDDGAISNYSYNALGHLLSTGDRTFVYDDNGRRIRVDRFGGGTTNYAYDFEHRLTQVDLPGSVDRINYLYDFDGNRVAKKQGNAEVCYVLDVAKVLPDVLVEIDGSGALLSSYVYADGELLSMTRDGVTHYVHSDVSTHIRLTTDSAGMPSDTFEYDAFGNITARTGTTDLPYRFAGQRYDADTGLYYLRARFYDPEVGQFLTSDPLSGDPMLPITFNRYLYAIADPVNMTDPSGLYTGTLSGQMAGIAAFSTMASTALQSFAALLASVKVQLFVVGVLSVAVAGTLANNPTALRQLEEQWEILKQQIQIWLAAAGAAVCGVPVFHYTDQVGAIGILATQSMFATPKFTGPLFTYPPGAYASLILPVGPMTRSQLSAHFYGGNSGRDVSWFVGICSNLNAFTPVGSPTHPDFFYRPAPAGFSVPVRTFTIGPNLMLP